MIKKIINLILIKYYAYKNNMKIINNTSGLSFRLVKTLSEGCKISGDVIITQNVKIGKHTSINGPATRISSHINNIKIGSYCSIASNVIIQEYYHKYDRISSYYINKNIFNDSSNNDTFSKGDIVIEDDVWIGSNSVILSGVTIGRGSIVAAGSIVTKNVPKYSIVGGNPAIVIKSRFKSQKTIEYLESLKWWEWDSKKMIKNKKLFNMNEEELIAYIERSEK